MAYQTVIGLEIHVQLKTKSKMFCRCDNNALDAAPNTLVCPICLGMPGTLPVANAQAIEWTIKTGLALGAEIAETSKFDRKHYFYPDLPKGYQISQYDAPFCKGGALEIENAGELKKISIRRIHLEEDAGKLLHQGSSTLVDLNRAGTPLMEIVTEPDLKSPADARLFMQELRTILRFLDVSDADMEKGHLRCDANISVAECQSSNDKCQMGTPTEIKNINSFRMVERALAYEEKRQKEELEAGKKIVKETRGWDDAKGETYSQRSKEQAQDYRYFPEPDLPPFEVRKVYKVDEMRKDLPELPSQKRKRIISDIKHEKGYGSNVHDSAVEALIKSSVLEKNYQYFVEKGLDKLFALMFVSHQMWGKLATGTNPDQFHEEEIYAILKDWWDKKINNIQAKELFELSLTAPELVAGKLKESEITISEEELEKIVQQVLNNNEKSAADFKNGKKEALSFLVGQVMRETRGQANPSLVNKILQSKLSED